MTPYFILFSIIFFSNRIGVKNLIPTEPHLLTYDPTLSCDLCPVSAVAYAAGPWGLDCILINQRSL